ncbi:MAG TPA: TIGR04013 family B12-binding domain/radical SAM domain-containing protein [Kofleriaceae bacterium]|nr:TIGR04013 family B12-binding domain/radical SAM domain-containing protein [Kofleriaceae bacterium]
MGPVRPAVVAYHVRSGIVSLNVVTGALAAASDTADTDVHFVRNPDEMAATLTALAAAGRPALAAWSFYSTDFSRTAADLARVRAATAATVAPGAVLHVAGGVHATSEPAATLRAGWDLVAIGEGEATLVALVRALAAGTSPRAVAGTAHLAAPAFGAPVSRDGELITTGAAPRLPLDTFPPFNVRDGRWNAIEITRGCIYACSFCQTPFMFKARFRHRPVDDVVRWVRVMVEQGGRYVRFLTPTALSYGSQDERVELAAIDALLGAVRAALPAGGKLYFGTFPSELRPEHVTPEAMALLARWVDNRHIVLGGQSGSTRVLAAMRRGHDVADVERAVAVAVAAGFVPDVDLLLGIPGEDADDQALTMQLARRLTDAGARIHSHAFMPLPGTPLKDAQPSPIAGDVAAALTALEGRAATYGQWRAQTSAAAELVQLRRNR